MQYTSFVNEAGRFVTLKKLGRSIHDAQDKGWRLMHELLNFVFADNTIRAGVDENGQFYAVAADVTGVLGSGQAANALRRLDEDEKGVYLIQTPGGIQRMAVVNQYGLYALVMSSRKPVAKPFKRWVIHELIPAVLSHGGYISPTATAEQVDELRAQIENQSREIERLKLIQQIQQRAIEDGEKARRWLMPPRYIDYSDDE